MKRVVVSVINDLSTDQRVHKVCTTLHKMGFDVLLVGRKQRASLELSNRVYATKRMLLIFEKGPFFYLEFQIRLFFFLLFKQFHVLVSNDLDTLLPNYIISKIKNTHLVYDTHEIFCEVPELKNSSFKKAIWKGIERFIFPKLKHVFTVNNSIAKIYGEEYRVPVNVVRNIPLLSNQSKYIPVSKEQLGLPLNKKIVLLQGAGINIDRGAEEAVEAMQYIKGTVLVIIGGGDVIHILKKMAERLHVKERVLFINKVPFEKLLQYTYHADIGLTLDKDTNINYRYSLPNKLFDYIHAGIPVLASNLVEIKNIIETYQVGTCIDNHHPTSIAETINKIFLDNHSLLNWKKNTKIAAEKLNWEIEEKQLVETYSIFL